MKGPEDIRREARTRFERQKSRWLDGEGSWPWVLGLEAPTESEVARSWEAFVSWVRTWRALAGELNIEWAVRPGWRGVGEQEIPTKVSFPNPESVARWIGQGSLWVTMETRSKVLVEHWPFLLGCTGTYFPKLAGWSDEDFQILLDTLSWFLDHSQPNCALREVPVPGLHTKWLEEREREVFALARALDLREDRSAKNLIDWAGFRKEEPEVHLRVLDPNLAATVGGLTDLKVRISEFKALPWKPNVVILVENKTSGLWLPPMGGTIAILGQGNAITQLGSCAWLSQSRKVYWGDLDTHGFVILHRARIALGPLTSILMDEETLLTCRRCWSCESSQDISTPTDSLTPSEQSVLDSLRIQRFGIGVRLEQERIPWTLVLAALRSVGIGGAIE